MPRPDRQLVAFAGTPDGQITFIDWRQKPGYNHTVIRAAGDHTPIEWSVGDIDADPALWEDALKVSGCDYLTVHAGVVKGGNEDVLDVNHSRHVVVNIEDAYPRGKYVSTQKGASDDITVNVRRQHGHGKEVDYDYGNHSDQGDGYTTNCKLNVEAVYE